MMESIEIFLRMETELGLNKRKLNDYSYWTYNRFDIFNWIDVLLNVRNEQSFYKKHSRIDRFKRLLLILLLPKYRIRGKVNKKELLVFNHARRFMENGVYNCVYTDELLKQFDDSTYQVMEETYEGTHLRPTHTSNLIYLDRMEYFKKIYVKIIGNKKIFTNRKLYNKVLKEVEYIKLYIDKYFKVSIDKEKLVELIYRNIFSYKFEKRFFKKLLSWSKPKLIIECVSYKRSLMIVNEIAKERCIKTVELQHGVMGPNHIGYNYLEKSIKQFPDMLLAYSDYWKVITKIPLEDKNIIAVGYPYFERIVNKYKNSEYKSKKVILFVSQTIIGMILSEFAVDLFEKIEGKSDLQIIYKLHPGEYTEWKKRYPRLAKSGIEVVDNNERSIYEFFSQSCIQIGVFSTAIYEGMGFDLITFILDAYRSEDMDEICKNGFAIKVNDVNILSEYILENREVLKVEKNCELWKHNALENMERNIRSELNKS